MIAREMTKKRQTIQPQIKEFRLGELRPARYNPRVISDEALAGLAASIKKFGCVEPIIVNTRDGKNTIIGGNQRFKVLSAAGIEKCICIIVDLNSADEKILNLTLNNPEIQGEFIKELGEYIDTIQREMPAGGDFLNLKIKQLREEIGDGPGCVFSQEELKLFKKTHVLLSFPPHLFAQIADHLEAIIKIEGIEYEQSSN